MPAAPSHWQARAVTVLTVCFLGLFLNAVARADPSTDYILHCRGCHRPDGSGVPGAAPSFRGQLAKFLWVAGGREYLIQVPGTAQSELSDARVAALLNWMLVNLSAAALPADFAPFREDEVARHRRVPLSDVGATRRALVQAIEAREAATPAAALSH